MFLSGCERVLVDKDHACESSLSAAKISSSGPDPLFPTVCQLSAEREPTTADMNFICRTPDFLDYTLILTAVS